MQYHQEVVAYEATQLTGTSQLLFLARHHHRLGISSQLVDAAKSFCFIIYNEIIFICIWLQTFYDVKFAFHDHS